MPVQSPRAGMRRREVPGVLGGTIAGPLTARAQQPAMPVIGLLDTRSSDTIAGRRVLRQGLRDIGYVERENVAVEYRWAENQLDRLPELAAELVIQLLRSSRTVAGGTSTFLVSGTSTFLVRAVFEKIFLAIISFTCFPM
jgi:putative ABC transport system substrate-binding protein